MKDELIRMLKATNGAEPTVEQLYVFMEQHGIMHDWRVRRAIIIHEFNVIFKSSNRTARDIEEELAVRYGLSREAVKKMRIWAVRKKV